VIKFIADVHAGSHRGFATPTNRPGVNSRLALALSVLEQVFAPRDSQTVVLGDLLDTDRPSPQVITAVMHSLSGCSATPQQTIVMRGNHDSSTPRAGDNALGPFKEAGFTVIESPRVLVYGDTALVLLPFNPEPPSEWVPAALAALRSDIEHHSGIHHLIIGSHFGLSDSDTPDFLSGGALPVDTAFALCSEYNACAWLSGDWHSRKVWERGGVTVAQVGALCPTGFDNPGLTGYGSVWTFEDGRLTWVELAGPRFVKYKGVCAALDEAASPTCTLRFAQVTVKAGEEDDARSLLAAAVEAGTLAGFEVISDRNEALENAGETAAYVATATSFEAALERAVQRLSVGAGVDRGEVLRRAKQRVAQSKGK
jgi:hypothetical protein